MDRKEFFIDMIWGRLAVVTYNSEDLPLVIFCHGRADSADTFLPLIEHLPPTHHYVTFDLPGCGYSDKLPPGVLLMTFCFMSAMKAVADHYGDKKFIFIGHSVGVQVGILYNIVTERSRITKFVDIDHLTSHQIELDNLDGYQPQAGGFDIHQWFKYYYVDAYMPKAYKKIHGTMETAPSYTKEQVIASVKKARHLPTQLAEVVLKRNLRPDPKNPGKYKLVLDQRMKLIARVPFSGDFWKAVRKEYSLPILIFLASETKKARFSTKFSGELLETLRDSSPYFKAVDVEGHHDIQLSAPEKLAPHIVEFFNLDLDTIKPKVKSNL